MLRNAPHLTSRQEFIIPVYTWWDTFLYTAGLTFYDLLAGRLSIGKSRYIGKKETLRRLPELIPDGLKGGVVYYDGQFDDSRMVISLARAAVDRGAIVLNYVRVASFLKDDAGRINGVKGMETKTGEEFLISGKVVINAAGVFADSIHKMDDPSSKPTIKPSQGVHVVIGKSFLPGSSAIMIPKTDDGRVLFAIPWYDEIVIGTTDTPLDRISSEPKALDSEIGFILNTAGRDLTKPPRREDVLCVFAGLRPLAADPDNPSSTREVSRRHKITLSPSGLLTIMAGNGLPTGGWQRKQLTWQSSPHMLEKRRCITSDLRLAGSEMESVPGRLRIYGDNFL